MPEQPTFLRLTLLAACWLWACGTRTGSSYDPGETPPQEPGLHAVHDARLRQVMAELKRPSDRLPQELDPEGRQSAQLRRIANIAEALQVTARLIPDALDEVVMGAPQRRNFRSLADRLATQAGELEQLARSESLRSLEAKVREINLTCESCHRSFRVLPVVSRPPDPSD